MPNKAKGFTLIELVVVIVILGILAATAAPKFIDVQSDAVIAKLKTVQGSIKSANSLVYSKALIHGEHEKSSGSVTSNGVAIATTDGFITATPANIIAVMETPMVEVLAGDEVTGADFGVYTVPTGAGQDSVFVIPEGYDNFGSCYVRYLTEAGHAEPTFYSLTTNGC